MSSGFRANRRECLLGGCGQIDRFAPVEATFTACEGQQSFDEALLLFARCQEFFERGTEFLGGRVRVGEGDFKERSVEGERGPQLVGGIGDEAPLGLEGVVESGQQSVDGVGEVLHLVIRSGEGKPFVQVPFGDLLGSGRHRP